MTENERKALEKVNSKCGFVGKTTMPVLNSVTLRDGNAYWSNLDTTVILGGLDPAADPQVIPRPELEYWLENGATAKTFDPDDYPVFETMPEDAPQCAVIPGPVLKAALVYTGKEPKRRPILASILLEGSYDPERRKRLVATDSYRMIVIDLVGDTSKVPTVTVMIPAAAAKIAVDLASKSDITVYPSYDRDEGGFKTDLELRLEVNGYKVRVLTKATEGQYVNYQQLIPDANGAPRVVVTPGELKGIAKAAKTLDVEHFALYKGAGDKVGAMSGHPGDCDRFPLIPGSDEMDSDLEPLAGFNAFYFADFAVLTVASGMTPKQAAGIGVTVSVNASNEPALATVPFSNGIDAQAILMPVRMW